jgi:spore coat protein CotH
MNKIIIAFLLIVSVALVKSQTVFPENGPLFNDEVVPRIDITINPDTLDWLYQSENLDSDIEFSARFIFNNGEIIDTIEPVGFRLRGNTSRHSQKKSFKVSFNRFTSGGKYYGVEKLNLNGEHNDPSVIRSKICWDIFRKMDIPASRSNHVQVYINGNYYGLYINVEHIDEEYIKTRFAYNDGNLYKCLYPADLNYLGEDPDLYKLAPYGDRTYELKINEEADDYSDIANFIDVLNNASADDLKCQLDEVFNTYDYLKIIAADILMGDWDGYIYNQNNYYIYHNTVTNKFEFIPYDYDNTLGIDWLNRDWGTRNIYDWQQHGDNYRPLYERIMNDEELRNQYTYYMNQLVTNTIDIDSLITAIGERRDMIAPYLINDPYYPLDYGYTMDDFYNSFNNALGGHVDYGLFPYLETRVSSIINQLENTEMDPVIKYIRHQKVSDTEAQVVAFVEAENNPADVSLEFSVDGSNWNSTEMYDDGNHNDGLAGDLIYGASIFGLSDDTDALYQIFASDSYSHYSQMPCNPVVIHVADDTPLLFINEFMASNNSTVADDNGNYSDWIEIYNGSDNDIWLGNLYLTDNLNSPSKWLMPDFTLAAGGFILFWADGIPENGEFHTNFKLSKDGEEIGVFTENYTPVDDLAYGAQTSDISYGRETDATIEWIFFSTPTPGESNSSSAVNEFVANANFSIFPNPASGSVVYLSSTINYKVYNIFGKLIDQGKNYDKINILGYNKGFYIIVSDKGHKQKLIVN